MAISNFNKRLLTSLVLVVVAVLVFLLRAFVSDFGIYVFDILILFVTCWGTWEICTARKLDRRGANAIVAIVIYALMYMFFLIGTVILETKLPWWLQILVSLMIVGIFVLFIGFSNMLDKKLAKQCDLQKKNLNKEAWGGAWDLVSMLIYPGIFFACAIVLNHLPTPDFGLFGLLLVVLISSLTDTFAYLIGLWLGKGTAKLAPKISPKKTWIGFIGGLFGGVLGALIAVWIISNNETVSDALIDLTGDAILAQLLFFVVGLIGAILTTIGDLFASYLKRRAGVKDFGHIFPGHGGVMDRFDGIMINIPFILLIMGII